MIPRKLKLRNFLSYQECELDFSSLHLAVLSGNNGDGKTALLDAITWALWGKARGQKEDDRIRLGAGHMLVDLEFEVDGARYRVVRKRDRGKSGKVDLFRLDGAGWAPMNGATNSDTDREIVKLLRMDHQTFLNSALLAQGAADEFTRRTPAARKEVLGKVLGLERYEEWADIATERRKAASGEAEILRDRIERAQAQVDELPGLQDQTDACEKRLQELASLISQQQAEVDGLRGAAQLYSAAEEALHQAEEQLAAAEAERLRLAAQLSRLRSDLAADETIVARGEEIRTRKAQLEVARATEREQLQKQAEHSEWANQHTRAEGEIKAEEAAIKSKLEATRKQVHDYEEEEAGRDALRRDEEALESRQRQLDSGRRQVEEARTLASNEREKAATLHQRARGCQDSIKEFEAREKQLRSARAACPVCKQPLTREHSLEVKADFERERARLKAQAGEANAGARKSLQQATALTNQADQLEKSLDEDRRALLADQKGLAARAERVEHAAALLPNLRRAAEELGHTLASGQFLPEARRRLAEAARKQLGVQFDESALAAARKESLALAAADREFGDLEKAETRTGLLRQQIEAETQAEIKAVARVTACTAAVESRRVILERLEDAGPRLQRAEQDLHCLAQDRDQRLSEQGRLQGAIEGCLQLRSRLAEDSDALRGAKEEEGVCADLAVAFGKNGVQALLVEQAKPEIERAANAILERTSAGRIQVQLHLLKTQGSGTHQRLADTLDIRISDDLGTRDYEMYSGGEKFRVDFALRIALSRLLAARAGASLPTLIVDEGFGSQDQQGVDRLVEALNTISDEFRLILVVTHLEELKGRFEQRIEVTKDPERGSIAVVR